MIVVSLGWERERRGRGGGVEGGRRTRRGGEEEPTDLDLYWPRLVGGTVDHR